MDKLCQIVIGIVVIIVIVRLMNEFIKLIPAMTGQILTFTKYGAEPFQNIGDGLFAHPQFTPQGLSVPLHTTDPPTTIHTNGPSIDGYPNSSKSMFMFSQNQCKPECCPSTYSCDKGCICPTANQKNFICNKGISN
jgi:hypothetical protein